MAKAAKKVDAELIVAPGVLSLGKCFTPTRVGMRIEGDPSLDECLEAVGAVMQVEGCCQWLVGDTLNYAEPQYGETYSKAIEETDYEKQTLRIAKYVCGSIELFRRRNNLSFGHHQNVAHLPPKQQDKWLDKAERMGWSNAKMRKAIKDAAVEQALKDNPWPDGKYRVIYADPPWSYNDQRLGTVEGGGAVAHYPLMPTEKICELQVKDLRGEPSVLFMWATSPLLPDAFEVIDAWGFEYKSSFVWDKVRGFNGHYNDVRHELMLVATHGSCVPESESLPPSIFQVEKTRHSAKPQEARDIIDRLYPTGPRVELFARETTEGWDVWGNEAVR